MRIEIYNPKLGDAIEELQKKYIAAQPLGTKFVPKELYDQHPALEAGRNVFCAFLSDRLVGYSALIPTPAEPSSPPDIVNTIWIHIRVDPEALDWVPIQEALYQAILGKSQGYQKEWLGRETRIAISYPDSRQEEIDFFALKGLEQFDALLQMRRDLSEPMQQFALPAAVTVRRCAMESEEGKEQYLKAEGAIFPHSPRTLEELDFYMQSWRGGTGIAAFDEQGRIVGSVMAYWYSGTYGVTEDVFVVPGWRGLGIAKHLITEGMKYLHGNGMRAAGLEVRESNQPAVGLYQSLGYRVVNREVQLTMSI